MDKKELRKIFNAGMKCQKLHPDDNSYDDVHFDRAISKLTHTTGQGITEDKYNPWPTIDVLSKLVDAADILLHKKDYDGHGWEEIEVCYKRGKEIIASHSSRLSSNKEGEKIKEQIINFALEAITRHDELAETNTSGKIFQSNNKWITIDELYEECFPSNN